MEGSAFFLFESASPGRKPIRVELKRRPAKRLIGTQGCIRGIPVRCSSTAPAAIDVDDICSDGSMDQECVVTSGLEFPHSKKQRKGGPLKTGLLNKKRMSAAQLMAQLSVVPQKTSGYNNNCLWFSTMLAAGELQCAQQFSVQAEQRSDAGRKAIHDELLRAPWMHSRNESWCAGMTLAKAVDIYQRNLMMREVHLFALANLRQQPILVIDTRKACLNVKLYRPGYSCTGLELSDEQVLKLECDDVLKIQLEGVHFKALLHTV